MCYLQSEQHDPRCRRRSAALAQFNTTDCSTLSTALAPSVAASAGPAVDDTQAGPLGLAELGAGASGPSAWFGL